ncbi:uncharacterized protein [Ptychodera flava]|uniref:uncharacterized protein n=1 Tax=Ptychodera flava TaxID=63121 RepID=UPI003969E175
MAAAQTVGQGVNLVLVTGASGFIAAHVTQQLLRAGYRVRGTVRSLQNKDKVAPLRNLCPDAEHELELVEADLLKPDTWKTALEGCTHVIHVASPFPLAIPNDENEVIKPAVEGTTSVLKACREVGTVKRVVLTSSVFAISGEFGQNPNHIYNENDWTDTSLPSVDAYAKSKTLAEKAAWEFVNNLPEGQKFELAVINPGFVMGPILSGSFCTSIEILKTLLLKEMPAVPGVNISCVDVRDVAAAHIMAMTSSEAAGNRHVLVAGNLWMKDIAVFLQKEFKSQGYNPPTLTFPKFGLRILSLFDSKVKIMLPAIGKVTRFDNTRMTQILQIQPRKLEDTVVEMGYSTIEGGFVKKTAKYRGPKK